VSQSGESSNSDQKGNIAVAYVVFQRKRLATLSLMAREKRRTRFAGKKNPRLKEDIDISPKKVKIERKGFGKIDCRGKKEKGESSAVGSEGRTT